jgi:tellurite resistance protein
MSLFSMFNRGKEEFARYRGDSAFLQASVAAAALIVNADGQIEDSELDAALKGLTAHELLSSIYKGSEIEDALNKAVSDSKTRAGRLALNRALESASARKVEERQDIFMIAADTADVGGIGDDEKKALTTVGDLLRLDAAKLLAA